MARPPSPARASHRNDHPSTPGNLGYFHLRLVGPAPALLLLRSDRLFSHSFSHRRGHRLRLLLACHRRRYVVDLLLSTSGCAVRLTHCSAGASAASVNGQPLRAGTHTELAVRDEVSVLRRGARYRFVVERFVSCGEGETTGSCKGEGLVLRAESLRKRLRAISESQYPLSFFRDSYYSGSGSADTGAKEFRQGGHDEVCLDHPIGPVPEVNFLREDYILEQDKLEHQADVAKDDVVEQCHESNRCGSGSVEQNKFSNCGEEQYPNDGCYSDGSTFFLNRIVGIECDTSTASPSCGKFGASIYRNIHPRYFLVSGILQNSPALAGDNSMPQQGTVLECKPGQ